MIGTTRFWKVAAVLLVMLGLSACGGLADGSPAPHQPTKYTGFLDVTGSISGAKRAEICRVALQSLDALNYGDSVRLFAIHDRTADAQPLVTAEIPSLPEDAGREEMELAHRRLAQTREGIKKVLEAALNRRVPATVTDVFSAIDRIRPDPKRRHVVLFFSDMLHSAEPDADFENGPLKAEEFDSLIQTAKQRRGWKNDALQGAGIIVVLPAAEGGERKPLNDARILRLFYTQMFEALGATLESFDSYIPSGGKS